MLHLHCLLESIVPLSRFMINYTILPDITFTYIYIYTHILLYSIHGVTCCLCSTTDVASVSVGRHRTPERLGDASPVLSTGSTGAERASARWVPSKIIKSMGQSLINRAWLMTIWPVCSISICIYIYPILLGNYDNPWAKSVLHQQGTTLVNWRLSKIARVRPGDFISFVKAPATLGELQGNIMGDDGI